MDEYKHVRESYSVVRDGKRVTVPTRELTPEEIRALADELRQRGKLYLALADDPDLARRYGGTPPTDTSLN